MTVPYTNLPSPKHMDLGEIKVFMYLEPDGRYAEAWKRETPGAKSMYRLSLETVLGALGIEGGVALLAGVVYARRSLGPINLGDAQYVAAALQKKFGNDLGIWYSDNGIPTRPDGRDITFRDDVANRYLRYFGDRSLAR